MDAAYEVSAPEGTIEESPPVYSETVLDVAALSSTAYPGRSNDSPDLAIMRRLKFTMLPSSTGRSEATLRATTPFSVASTTTFARTACRPLLSAKTTPDTRPSPFLRTSHACAPVRN